MTDEDFKRFKKEIDQASSLRDNLTATQTRCSELIQENRSLHKQIAQMKKNIIALVTRDSDAAREELLLGW